MSLALHRVNPAFLQVHLWSVSMALWDEGVIVPLLLQLSSFCPFPIFCWPCLWSFGCPIDSICICFIIMKSSLFCFWVNSRNWKPLVNMSFIRTLNCSPCRAQVGASCATSAFLYFQSLSYTQKRRLPASWSSWNAPSVPNFATS